MNARTPLTTNQINEKLMLLKNWNLSSDGKAIMRSYKFSGFLEAINFMNMVAIVAEQLDHHPNWLNVYNRIDVTLTTHSVGQISALDFQLATAMDEIFQAQNA